MSSTSSTTKPSAADQPSSAAAAALSDGKRRETRIAAAVCCSAWFGVACLAAQFDVTEPQVLIYRDRDAMTAKKIVGLVAELDRDDLAGTDREQGPLQLDREVLRRELRLAFLPPGLVEQLQEFRPHGGPEDAPLVLQRPTE